MKLPYSIETYNLTKRFPVIRGYYDLFLHPFRKKETPALSDVNIQINKGELFGLLGPNGAGKTTLIKILCTLVLPTSGRAFVNGMEVTRHGKNVRKTIGYVISDERSFYWRLTGRQNLRFFAKLNNIPNREAEPRIERLLESMELESDADRMFKDYSSGMRKKLAIIRGLLTNPGIIFMDEPTNGLDPIAAQSFRKFIREKLVGEEKRTVVFATHDLQEAEDLCDRIAIMNKGEVKITGTVREIRKTFQQDKRYVIRLVNTENGLIDKICQATDVKKVIQVPNGSGSQNVIEVEMANYNGNASRLIGELLALGIEISSFYEKEPPLQELFSKIVGKPE